MEEGTARKTPTPGLWKLTRAFGWVGVISMGGGRFAFYFNELVTRRRWLSEEAILEDYALANLLPGPNIGNFATLMGRRLRQLRGATLALAATLIPGALLMLLLSVLYFSHGKTTGLDAIFRGLGPAAAGLTIATTAQIAWKAGRTPLAVAFALVTVLAILVLGLPALLTILVLGGAASVYYRRQQPA
jgi:chromate transporter